jgi:hypothetical protein
MHVIQFASRSKVIWEFKENTARWSTPGDCLAHPS